MTDSDFIRWMRDRLIYVYGESPNLDYVRKMGEIADKLDGATILQRDDPRLQFLLTRDEAEANQKAYGGGM